MVSAFYSDSLIGLMTRAKEKEIIIVNVENKLECLMYCSCVPKGKSACSTSKHEWQVPKAVGHDWEFFLLTELLSEYCKDPDNLRLVITDSWILYG